MSTLFVVRHGQASFMSDDYDRLSALGQEQAHFLGTYWATLGMQFDRVYVGSLRRQKQTEAGVAAVYRERGLPWPEAEILPELNEHQGPEVMAHILPELAKQDPAIRAFVEAGDQRGYLKTYQKVMRMWARKELTFDQFESWSAFRTRVESAIQKIMAANSRRQKVVAFTSGGPVGVTTGFALALTDEQVMELSWIVRNATYSEFRFTDTRFSLTTFNTNPHFQNPELLTYI